MTLPLGWAKRRLRVPVDVRLRFADLAENDRLVLRGVPVTTAARTVNDCARAHVEPHLVGQALREGFERGLFGEGEVVPARAYVQEQGG